MKEALPLQGITVIELASVLAGPSVGTFLAELGAKVIKIENPTTNGDTTRAWKTSAEDPKATISSYYASANWGKQIEYLDLTQSEHQTKLHQLLKGADIVLENFKPGDDAKFKLEYSVLKELYPRLIVGHIQGFPESTRPAFDIVLQAETGFMSLNGNDPNGLKWPLPIVDILAAHQLKEGILIALLQRSVTNQGSRVSVSLYEAATASLFNVAGNVLMGHADPIALGRLHPNISPYGETITTKDGATLVLAIGTDRQFADLVSVLGLSTAFKLKFSTNSARISDRKQLEIELRDAAVKITFAELESELISKKIPFGRVRTVKEVLAEQPDDSFLRETIEGCNTIRMRTAIFKIER